MTDLLIVEGDTEILSLLANFFAKQSYRVALAETSDAMFAVLREHPIDLVILDGMLRNEDGFTLCRRVRDTYDLPVILLTAGPAAEAGDYLIKPFDQKHLLARVKAALLRETSPNARAPHPPLRFSGWRLDVARRELWSVDDALILLSDREFDLLLAFADHPRQILSPDHLSDIADLDIQVARLRHKLENPTLIRTVHKDGYMFTPTVNRE